MHFGQSGLLSLNTDSEGFVRLDNEQNLSPFERSVFCLSGAVVEWRLQSGYPQTLSRDAAWFLSQSDIAGIEKPSDCAEEFEGAFRLARLLWPAIATLAKVIDGFEVATYHAGLRPYTTTIKFPAEVPAVKAMIPPSLRTTPRCHTAQDRP